MILDAQNQFSDSQALTATALSTNVIDLGVARAIGTGEPMAVVINVEVAADQTSSDEDYTFAVEFASDAAITTNRQEVGRRVYESGTPTAPAQDADLLVVGYKVIIPIPPSGIDDVNRYIGVRYTLAGTSPSITVSAHLQPQNMIDSYTSYADGYAIT